MAITTLTQILIFMSFSRACVPHNLSDKLSVGIAALRDEHAISLPKLSHGAKYLIYMQFFFGCMFIAAVLVVLCNDSGERLPMMRRRMDKVSLMNASFFQIRVVREPDTWIVSLSGDVDYAASLELAPQLAEIADNCDVNLFFDLGSVSMIDSEGIKALLCTYARMRGKQRNMRVTNCSQPARRVLHLVGVDEMLGLGVG